MPHLRIQLLDRFIVTVDGVPVPESAWRGERSRTLLQFLATRPQGRTTRDELMEALWSHLPAEQARGSLHVTVNRLRRALSSVAPGGAGEQLVVATPTGYQLSADTWVDVVALHELVEEVRALPTDDRAAALRKGDDFSWAHAPELQVDQPYTDWVTAVRERVRRDHVSLQMLRADLFNSSGRSEQALQTLLRVLDSEPVMESAARQAMLIAYNLGNQVLALSIFDRCRHALLDELGVTPLPETLALHARILAQQQTAATSEAPVARTTWIPGPVLSSDRMTYLCAHIQRFDRLHGQPADLVEEALGRYMTMVVQTVNSHDGALSQNTGTDGTMIAQFSHPGAAVAAALALGQKLHAARQGGLMITAGLALHTGDVVMDDGPGADSVWDRCANLAAIAHGGQVLLSAALAGAVREMLPPGTGIRDLGAHRLADLAAAEHVHQLEHPSLPADFPALASLDTRPGNLPVQLSSFVGRRRELDKVRRLLRSSRLLTLTGAGGAGKTRLALQASAAAALEAFDDGVWFVDLAPLSVPSLVGVAVEATLGLHDQDQRPPHARLSAYLKSRQALLVLDNCEHLIGACAELVRTLLQSCPQLSILATSRESLGIQGEVVVALSGLPVPEADALADLHTLCHFDAIRLFLQRVRAVNPSLTLADLSPVHVARICRRLDGLPLALELAAARTRALSVQQIADRLDDRFRLLTVGSRTADARQQTLLATIDWSHGLLTEPERILLRRLSVFAGGCTLEMAEEVCAGDGVERGDVLDLLSQLVDRSLLVADRQGAEVRYGLLETIRHYAADKLSLSGEAVALADRHLTYFSRMVLNGAPNSLSKEQKAWFDRLESEMDNIRVALTWSLTSASLSDGLIIVTYLSWFWDARGHVREGREATAMLLARPDGPSAGPLWARAILSASSLAFSQLDCAEAIRLGTKALPLLREMDDPLYVAACLMQLGWATLRAGDLTQAQRYFDEAVEITPLPALAFAAHQGLGHLYCNLREYDRAEAVLDEAMTSVRMLGNPRGIAMTYAHQGALALERGRYYQALALLTDAVDQLEQLGDVCGISIPLGSLARVLHRMGRLDQAARLFGAIEGLRERTGTGTVGSDPSAYQASLAATRSAMGEAFTAIYTAGSEMGRSDLISYVRSLVSPR